MGVLIGTSTRRRNDHRNTLEYSLATLHNLCNSQNVSSSVEATLSLIAKSMFANSGLGPSMVQVPADLAALSLQIPNCGHGEQCQNRFRLG